MAGHDDLHCVHGSSCNHHHDQHHRDMEICKWDESRVPDGMRMVLLSDLLEVMKYPDDHIRQLLGKYI